MALLNLDAGEHADEPEELWALFDVLNIACGGHAGDDASMERVVRFCVASERTIGAHPSYPDRAGFGRRTMAIEPEALGGTVAPSTTSSRTGRCTTMPQRMRRWRTRWSARSPGRWATRSSWSAHRAARCVRRRPRAACATRARASPIGGCATT